MRQSCLTRALPFVLMLVTSCREAARATDGLAPPPVAEFVLAAGDSAFWVTSGTTGIHLKAAPLELARVAGRFFEVYVIDEDLSFQEADLVGQRVYRRDLRTGDSVLVFTDPLVPRLAAEYGRLHPDDRRLGPDEDPDDEPRLRATATLELGAAHGEFVSYVLHTDVERAQAPLWHMSRRGVLDLRTGRSASLSDVVGAESSNVERRRDDALKTFIDSVRSSRDERGLRASALLSHYHLDPQSFEITTVDGGPAIAYALPGGGQGDAGHMLPLPPIPFGQPAWWTEAAASLPTASADRTRDVWHHGSYAVVVRYDSLGDARLSLRDSTSREWTVGPVSSPATRVYWLDRPDMDVETRHALTRAFDEAATYGTEAHVAVADHRRTLLTLTAR